jgi:hypothetical protein
LRAVLVAKLNLVAGLELIQVVEDGAAAPGDVAREDGVAAGAGRAEKSYQATSVAV